MSRIGAVHPPGIPEIVEKITFSSVGIAAPLRQSCMFREVQVVAMDNRELSCGAV